MRDESASVDDGSPSRSTDTAQLRALHRIATLVAEGVEPQDLFAVVAEEVARVLMASIVNIARYESDDTITLAGSFTESGPLFPVGDRWPLDGTNVASLVHKSAEPARLEHYPGLVGEIADAARRQGIRSAVGVPIMVAGRLWGTIVVSSTDPDPLPTDTETRLGEFTELLGVAIANAESREALERLAEEQAALRRVATLVAQGVPASEVFAAVTEEVAALFGEDLAAVGRFDVDRPLITFVGVSKGVEAVEIGTSVELTDEVPTGRVQATGRPARVDRPDWSDASQIGYIVQHHGVISIVSAPIVVEGRLWGAVSVQARTRLLPPDTETRLERFSELVATAIANAESRSELAASRRRIVAASDDARRRIERNLHDGTQQRLVSLGLAVRAAEVDVPPELTRVRAELSKIATGLADATAELQEISRGIHPATLAQSGIGAALRTLGRRSPIPVILDIGIDGRLPEAIEVAAYYVASEALANAAKHAHATQIRVSLAPSDDNVLLEIADDGIGGADASKGSGLIGLIDRVQALGGSIDIRSTSGRGTRITALLPVDPESAAPLGSLERPLESE